MGREGACVVPAASLLPATESDRAVWRRLKGYLMPRRFYDSVAELREAVLRALHLLGAVEIQCLLGGT